MGFMEKLAQQIPTDSMGPHQLQLTMQGNKILAAVPAEIRCFMKTPPCQATKGSLEQP